MTPRFQQRVAEWLVACFGRPRAHDRTERTHRFLEEALELAQACGCTRDDALKLVDYTFARPVGDVTHEVGGVAVTLAALCTAHKVQLQLAADAEHRRNWEHLNAIRAKADAKPLRSPLPQ